MFDSNFPQKLEAPTIQKWEEAGAALTLSLSKYLDMCISLGPDSRNEGAPPKALATRIDSVLGTLHTRLEHQIDQARSILAWTQNQLRSLISHFPSEILSEIFAHVIFDPIDLSEPVSMEDSLTNIYQSVHNFLGVCSAWRDVILSRGSFWSIVPVIESKRSSFLGRQPGKSLFTDLSLERSGNADLHLAAIASEGNLDVKFTEHASRFSSINILSESNYKIAQILDHFLKPLFSDRIPPERSPLSSLHFSSGTNFENILKSLSVLRLSDIIFDWNKIEISHRLVKLELQQLTFGSDLKLVKFLPLLSSVTELRTLKLISVFTYPNLVTSQNTTIQTDISFPKLQTLVAQNFFFNTLDILLSSIKSRSHRLTLHLTKRTFEHVPSDGLMNEDPTQRVFDLFRQVTVHKLLLGALAGDWPWLYDMDIWGLLSAMPDIETLRMHNWSYNTDFCKMIKRPDILNNCKFPRIKNMHLTQATIRDEEAFKEMVASYFESLECMELAGAVVEGWKGATSNAYLEGKESIVAWLKENVPKFDLTSNYKVPVEFCAPVWQLW